MLLHAMTHLFIYFVSKNVLKNKNKIWYANIICKLGIIELVKFLFY